MCFVVVQHTCLLITHLTHIDFPQVSREYSRDLPNDEEPNCRSV